MVSNEQIFFCSKRTNFRTEFEKNILHVIQNIWLKIFQCFQIHSGHVNVVKYLVGHGAEINTRDEYGNTPLISAAFEGMQFQMNPYIASYIVAYCLKFDLFSSQTVFVSIASQ